MFYHPKTQTKIPENTPFLLEGLQYPSNWLNLSTSDNKQKAGLVEIIEMPPPEYDSEVSICIPGELVEQGGFWSTSWKVIPLPQEAIDNQKEAKNNLRIIAIDEKLLEIDASVQRSLREVSLAVATGETVSDVAIAKLNKAEEDATALRQERSTLVKVENTSTEK